MNPPLIFPKLKTLDEFHIKKINTNKNQFSIFSKIYEFFDNCFIFESLSGPKELTETSIIGFDPIFTIKCNSKNFIVLDNKQKIIKISKITEPLSQIRSFIPKIIPKNVNYRYIGGAVGYVSYEAINYWEKLPRPKKKILDFPLMEFGIYTDGILYDHIENKAYYFYTGKASRYNQIDNLVNKDTNNGDLSKCLKKKYQ